MEVGVGAMGVYGLDDRERKVWIDSEEFVAGISRVYLRFGCCCPDLDGMIDTDHHVP